MYLKVKDHENLVRDTSSNAILNTDKRALEEYMKKREMLKKEKEEKKAMENRITNLENTVNEIFHLLKEMSDTRKV